MKLATKRLILRPFTLNDVDAVQKYSSKESVTRYMMWGPNKYEDTKRFVSSVVSRNSETPRDVFDFIVTLKDGTVIGACGLYFDEYPKPPTLGWVFDDTYWNQGYGTETGRALLAFGFNTLKVKSILATCDNENIASARIMEKIGMRYVETRPEELPKLGKRFIKVYEITALEYKLNSNKVLL
ncbi:MAG: GNAT family N-acetyltransferase [Bacilli bacterium]|jgi:ribosomal-protein-alanine N-acetyltransferase|nr:GNAT family N-acetyltransferase [Erysipelotrichaceae bacterium]HOE53538.1 GNAT family N-acetyltransferase [Bacilli bacterium]HOQ70164.1 GNAT family N-acetyltransferase [Bacilli bacterium]HPK29186.1 GNAT family N-acetyltransferase [Bacilli bacterium]HPY78681.1 GNAT family N-acetyltransferase [Bacilli bacterium]